MLPLALFAVGGAVLYYALRREGGAQHSKRSASAPAPRARTLSNPDRFESLEQVKDELTRRGLESCNLIIGIDFTKSNTWTGKETFLGKCLHDLSADGQLNPYQHVISVIARSLVYFDDDQLVPVYGFGDTTTNDRDVFSFNPADQPCVGLHSILERYSALVPLVRMAGPTSFGPIIRRAIDIVESTGRFHLLIIIADGQVTSPTLTEKEGFSVQEKDTIDAIVEASKYPLSIVMVGVGDGPWDQMETFDDAIPSRDFDNFQFVNYHKVIREYARNPSSSMEAIFAMHALMELPDQFTYVNTRMAARNRPISRVRQVPKNPPIGQLFTNQVSMGSIWDAHPSNGNSIMPPSAPSPDISTEVASLLCPICLAAPVNSVFQCGHSCCQSCGNQISICHICRSHIISRNPLFL